MRHAHPVLVVDDDPAFRALVAELLARAGFVVEEAGDGDEAVAAAERVRPVAVILDVRLPTISGYEVCRELRDAFGDRLPIVFVSGERVEGFDRAAGMLVGADDYLVKPIDPDELLARVRRLAERQGAELGTGNHPELTDREIEVLQLVAEGMRPTEIGRELVISPKTVSSHVQRILAKLDVHTRAQAVAVAYEAGLLRVSARSS